MHAGRPHGNATRGFVIPIGGAENRVQNPVVLRRFVKLCGGPRAHIAVIPTASSLDDTGQMYESVFGQIGAGRISILPFKKRSDCESKQYLDVLNCVDGVFMTGGDQVRLTELLNDTSVARSLRERNAHGVHIAGTSAGASAMSSAMIAGGRSGATPRAGMVELAPGFGLIDRFVIDQHFSQRDRLGRLLTAVASIPFGAGIGLDEDTAAFIGPDNTLEVVGSGSVTIIDGAILRNASGASIDHGQAVGLTGVQLHILVDGNKYDLANHTLVSLGLGAKSRLTHDVTTLLT